MASSRENCSAFLISYCWYIVLAFFFFFTSSPFFLFFCGLELDPDPIAFSFFDNILGAALPRLAHGAVVDRNLTDGSC
jgi:hypothetical protein